VQPDVARGDARGAWELAVDIAVGDVEVAVVVRGGVDDRAELEHDGLPRARRGDLRAHAHLRSLSDALDRDDLRRLRRRGDVARAGAGRGRACSCRRRPGTRQRRRRSEHVVRWRR
jgi:hypothetical protein